MAGLHATAANMLCRNSEERLALHRECHRVGINAKEFVYETNKELEERLQEQQHALSLTTCADCMEETPSSPETPSDLAVVQVLPDCPICLEQVVEGAAGNMRLACGHHYCMRCIARFVTTCRTEHSSQVSIGCPCCKATIGHADMRRILGTSAASPTRQTPARRISQAATPLAAVAVPTAEERRALARAARSLNLRYCPGCNRPILKNGGCPNMTCPCGRRFNWDIALAVAPCRHPHKDEDANMPFWRTNCSQCSAAARIEKRLIHTGAMLVAAPVAAVAGGLAIGTVATAAALAVPVAVTPAVIFTPPALVYEAASRLKTTLAPAPKQTFGSLTSRVNAGRRRKKTPNPFVTPAVSGLYAAGIAGYMCCAAAFGGYDSD
uniref:RING-type domain-containing protein n=1 Tax=Haptolina brevifila TaxID=156173 RepID=A0A7S2BR19_9EUKA